jgi:hypothetical protein
MGTLMLEITSRSPTVLYCMKKLGGDVLDEFYSLHEEDLEV